MEQRKLPGVRDVITKLRSDGIFDNFRKSCVNSIENEVCNFSKINCLFPVSRFLKYDAEKGDHYSL